MKHWHMVLEHSAEWVLIAHAFVDIGTWAHVLPAHIINGDGERAMERWAEVFKAAVGQKTIFATRVIG